MANKKKKKFKAKKFQQYRQREPLLKSYAATTTDVARIDADIKNRADVSLERMTQNSGIPRQKVRMK